MQDFGKIVSLTDDLAQVSIQPHGGCENCGMKAACAPGENTQLLWAVRPPDKPLKVGDEVVVEVKPQVKVMGSALVFIFPLAGLFPGYFAGYELSGGSNDYGVLGAFGGLVLFFALVRLIDRFAGRKAGLKPMITQVLR